MPGYRLRISAHLLVLCALLPSSLFAASVYESEPNNTPADSNPIAGAVSLLGSLLPGDQDAYLWTVSDVDARKRWTFELQGVAGALTIAQVFTLQYADNGVDVTASVSLMKMGTRDGSAPSVAADLLFEPGEYLIGFARAGGTTGSTGASPFRPPASSLSFGQDGQPEASADELPVASPGIETPADPGGYRFTISEGKHLLVRADRKPGLNKEEALDVNPGAEFASFQNQESAWYRIPFQSGDLDQRWDMTLQAPVGRVSDAALYNSAGTKLINGRTNDRGLLKFADIAPDAGPYSMELIATEPGFIQVIGSTSVGIRVEGEEAEPNDNWRSANRFDPALPLIGRSGKRGEEDHFQFEMSEPASDSQLRVEVSTKEPGQALALCLYNADGQPIQCRKGATPVRLPDLVLQPGTWGLRVSGAAEGTEYELSLSTLGAIEPGMEAEPNDTVDLATTVPAKNRIKGSFDTQEEDFFRFVVTEEPQLWRFQVIGDGLTQVAYVNAAGQRIQSIDARGSRRARLENLFLMPGVHYLKVSGKAGGSYTMIGRSLGPPDPNGEREPNDDESRMQRLAIGQTRTGLLAEKSDQDRYRFFLANSDHIQLLLTPPADGKLNAVLYWQGAQFGGSRSAEPGETIELKGVYPPGDYQLVLTPTQVSDAEYKLALTRLPRYSCAADCEPNGNNQYYGSADLPGNGLIEGIAGTWGGVDSYQLPLQDDSAELIIRSEKPVPLSLGADKFDSKALRYDAETGSYQATLLPDLAYQLIVDSRGSHYRLQVEIDGQPANTNQPPLEAELAMNLVTDTVAAYRSVGQQVSGTLNISNTSADPFDVFIDATTSDYRWRVTPDQSSLTVAANSQVEVGLTVQVPADAWAGRLVRISARIKDANDAQIESWQDISVARDLSPLQPTMGWSVPTSLLGGFNMAWAPLGARWVGSNYSGTGNYELLFNDLVYGRNMHCCPNWKDGLKPALTIELPGTESVPVAGMAINHRAARGTPWSKAREVALLLSEDGETFHEVLSVHTQPIDSEQYFALEEPQQARFARLRIDSTFSLRSGNFGVTIGEWKVIAKPGFDLSAGVGYNLATPELGGHVVSDVPRNPNRVTSVLDETREESGLNYLGQGNPFEYVIGFHHNRAARIRRVDWVYSDKVPEGSRFESVAVSVSTESPVGPWLTIGDLATGLAETPAVLDLDVPLWARFVRFTSNRPEGASVRYEPRVIRIWEQSSDVDYRSILAEWGNASRAGDFERQRGLPEQGQRMVADNGSRERAAPLAPDQLITGQVALARQEQWYRLQMPTADNVLRFEMTGDPTVRSIVELETAAGSPVPVRRLERESTPIRHVAEAVVESGSELFIRVSEPPRNVMFTWDTSASVNAYLPTIYNSLTAFASQVVPGQEAVNLLPFSDLTPLLRDWYGEPYVLQTILNDYPRGKSSSSGETALMRSTDSLATRAGSKAVLIITDGRVVHDPALWESMSRIHPRVFGVHIGGLEPFNQDLFQDWASVNGGDYRNLIYDGEMEVAFDRAATLLRRPADFTLNATTSYREAPGPGLLSVVGGVKTAANTAAVELILDASGSMLQRLDGKRRIVIAKEVLTEAVTDHIPPGTPVALRVFGNKEPDACRTDLEIPLQPLDPAVAVQTIAGIEAMNLARTPIAASLAAVSGDLKNTKGRVVIVLVTDGEETCDGDPAKAIAGLKAQGIDVHLNIVGFAIDKPDLVAQFSDWAEQGGGRYLSANNQEGLSEAIAVALQTHYTVYNASGESIAEGLVGGEALELEQGTYRVVVDNGAATTFDNVELLGEREQTLTVN